MGLLLTVYCLACPWFDVVAAANDYSIATRSDRYRQLLYNVLQVLQLQFHGSNYAFKLMDLFFVSLLCAYGAQKWYSLGTRDRCSGHHRSRFHFLEVKNRATSPVMVILTVELASTKQDILLVLHNLLKLTAQSTMLSLLMSEPALVLQASSHKTVSS